MVETSHPHYRGNPEILGHIWILRVSPNKSSTACLCCFFGHGGCRCFCHRWRLDLGCWGLDGWSGGWRLLGVAGREFGHQRALIKHTQKKRHSAATETTTRRRRRRRRKEEEAAALRSFIQVFIWLADFEIYKHVHYRFCWQRVQLLSFIPRRGFEVIYLAATSQFFKKWRLPLTNEKCI